MLMLTYKALHGLAPQYLSDLLIPYTPTRDLRSSETENNFSNTVHYCRSSMPRFSQMLCFLQSPSFQQAQSAVIGQLTQCIVIGRTPQATSEM